MATVLLGGERSTGSNVRAQNVMAAVSIANIVKSSLGPVGLDKMLVDDVGDVTITNDGATILKLLEVEHPAAKVLCELADLQDQEVGDGTTSVVLIAAELLKNADELIKFKIHPTSIISGYRLACREACKYIQDQLSISTEELGTESILNVAKTSMSSKLVGIDSDFFANMVVDGAMAVKRTGPKGETKCPIKSVNILKAHGGNMKESRLIQGYALNCTVASEGMPKRIANAKIAFLDFSLQKSKMHLGVQVLIEDPEKLEGIRKREADITKERIQKILGSGADVILTTGGIDDLCLKYFVEAGAMAVRRCKKADLKRIARATGGSVVLTLANLEGEESFDGSVLGQADEVVQERVCDDELILIKGPKAKSAASIILRGANDFMVDEMERSLHDALCAVKRVMESKSVVPGGGAVEAALSIYLENFATSLASREQLAIAEFANSLLVIPKTLAVNAAKDSADLVAKLRAYHNTSQIHANKANLKWLSINESYSRINWQHTNKYRHKCLVDRLLPQGYIALRLEKSFKKFYGRYQDLIEKYQRFQNSKIASAAFLCKALESTRVGLDLLEGTARDNKKAGVLEPAISKIKCLKFATEAAITILRIDDMIKIEPDKKDDEGSYGNARAQGRL